MDYKWIQREKMIGYSTACVEGEDQSLFSDIYMIVANGTSTILDGVRMCWPL